jgi:tetratricopeptide (TPR) repeat protein
MIERENRLVNRTYSINKLDAPIHPYSKLPGGSGSKWQILIAPQMLPLDWQIQRTHRDLLIPIERVCGLLIRIVWFLFVLIPNRVDADDYFNRITVASNGRLTRFQHDTITVYATAVPLAGRVARLYELALTEAVKLWEEATDRKLRFRSTPLADAADIRIQWLNQRRKRGLYDSIGEAVLVRQPNGVHVEITLFLRDATTLKLLEPEVIQTALLHELGHAIGLWGHSEDENDVMYFAATAQKPTGRDISTWLKVDQTPVDAPFHNQAIATLQEAIGKEPELAEHYYSLGTVYADLGDYQSAIQTFQKALEINPTLRTSAAQVASIFQKNGIHDLAIQHYTRALGRNPSPDVLGALGTLSLIEAKFDRAVDYLQQALRLAPDSATLNQNLLAAYHRWGLQMFKGDRLAEATQCLERGLARFPFSEVLLFDLAATFEAAKDYEKALKIYQRILQINPQYIEAKSGVANALNNLGVQHADKKDWEVAIGLYQDALEHDPDCLPARQNLEEALMLIGWQKNQTGDLDGAQQTYHRLLKLNPKSAQAYNNLGIIHFRKQEYHQSTVHFEKAISLNADYDEARVNLSYIKRKQAFDTVKRAIGPLLFVVCVSLIIGILNARRMRG